MSIESKIDELKKEMKEKMESYDKAQQELLKKIDLLSDKIEKLEVRESRLDGIIKVLLAFVVPLFILILGNMIKDPTIHMGNSFFITLAFIVMVFILFTSLVRKQA